MLWIFLAMLSISSLSAFSASVSRALGASPAPAGARPADGTQGVDGIRQARAEMSPKPSQETFDPGLRLAPPPARPGTPLPRGSLLDLSV